MMPKDTPDSPRATEAEEITHRVREEFAKFLEKRDALRKSFGRRRRSALLATTPDADSQLN